jgi:CRISPR-associated protein Csx10
MKRYLLRLVPEQPLRLEDETTIPAAALRGALAEVLLATCVPGHEHDTGPCSADCRYWTLFGEGVSVRFSPGYLGTGDDTAPLLLTARTCSRVTGFKAAGGHGVFDVAIRQSIFEQASVAPQQLLAPFSLRCPQCNASLIAYAGLVTRQSEREYQKMESPSRVIRDSQAVFGRTRREVIVAHAVTAMVIARSHYFVARLELPEGLEAAFKQAISGGLWIGAGRMRGYGAVRAELVADTISRPALNERLKSFNRAVRAEQRFYAAMAPVGGVSSSPDDGEWYFTLDLSVPALAAYAEQPSIIPELAQLPGIVPIRSWLSSEVTGGWHGAAGLPRRTGLGVTGVVLYRVAAENNRAAVDEVLAFLDSDGIGVGRERGYGAVRVCDPFHLNLEPL